ncbi:MAG: hypothetical protein RBR67_05005 [Desulfobacterium sp.]|jgi:hypothetical protein|nr:hypothetical protein [Desulfobacterium sp.]
MVSHEKNITFLLTGLFLFLLVGFLWIPTFFFSGSLPGHLIGILGTCIMGYTLLYPFRKRVLGKKGKQNPLKFHIYAGLIGPSLVIIHSEHTYASWTGTLAFISMVAIVLSGLIGRYLFRKVNRSIKDQKRAITEMRKELALKKTQIDEQVCASILGFDELAKATADNEDDYDEIEANRCEELLVLARSIVDTEYTLQGFAKIQALFKKWLKVHIYLTAFLFAMILVHVMSTIYYGLRWLP